MQRVFEIDVLECPSCKASPIIRVKLRQVRDGRVKFAVDRVSRPMEVFRAVHPYYKGADREILSVLCRDSTVGISVQHNAGRGKRGVRPQAAKGERNRPASRPVRGPGQIRGP